MSTIKPIHLMYEKGLSELEKRAIREGAEEVLKIVGVEDKIKIIEMNDWKNNNYLNNDGSLKKHQSLEWYLEKARQATSHEGYLEANRLLDVICTDPQYKSFDRYVILGVSTDICSGNDRLLGGLASGPNCVVTAKKFQKLDEKTKYECIKTATMHEVGHIFSLVSYSKGQGRYRNGLHCANKCVMRQTSVPYGLIKLSEDRQKHGPFCKPCEKDLKEWFKEKTPRIGQPKILSYKRRN